MNDEYLNFDKYFAQHRECLEYCRYNESDELKLELNRFLQNRLILHFKDLGFNENIDFFVGWDICDFLSVSLSFDKNVLLKKSYFIDILTSLEDKISHPYMLDCVIDDGEHEPCFFIFKIKGADPKLYIINDTEIKYKIF